MWHRPMHLIESRTNQTAAIMTTTYTTKRNEREMER